MKEFILEDHSWCCQCNSKKKDGDSSFHEMMRSICYLNPERVIIFANNDFYLITYFNCKCFGDKPEFVEKLVSELYTEYKETDTVDLYRGNMYEEKFKEFRLRGVKLKKYIHQAHFVYYNAAGKEFAIVSNTPFSKRLTDNEEIKTNYNKASQLLIDKKLNYLSVNLDRLFNLNYIYVSDLEIAKTTDHLIELINKKTKS